MGYGIHPYAVPLSEVESAVGSKDESLLNEIADWASDELDRLDEQFEADAENYDAPDEAGFGTPAKMRDALRDLIFDVTHDNQIAARRYLFLVELLCRYFGEFLPNNQWSPFSASWIGTVDDALAAVGVPGAYSVSVLTGRGAPVKIPRYLDAAPSVGFLRGAEVAAASAAFGAAIPAAELPGDVSESVEQIEEWLYECEVSGRDLVCFLF